MSSGRTITGTWADAIYDPSKIMPEYRTPPPSTKGHMIHMPPGRSLILPAVNDKCMVALEYDLCRMNLMCMTRLEYLGIKGPTTEPDIAKIQELIEAQWAKGSTLSERLLRVAHTVKLIEDGKMQIKDLPT